MTVTEVKKDPDNRTLTLTARFDAPVARVWRVWDDPRQLERWWGPPTYPATVVDHDLSAGGRVNYFMTGPEGDKHHGWWRIVAVDAPHGLDFEDGFSDSSGTPNEEMPVTEVQVRLRPDGDATVMTVTSRFPSREAMEQMVAMGMEEGLKLSVGQIDALLAEPAG